MTQREEARTLVARVRRAHAAVVAAWDEVARRLASGADARDAWAEFDRRVAEFRLLERELSGRRRAEPGAFRGLWDPNAWEVCE